MISNSNLLDSQARIEFQLIAEALRAWVGANDTPSLWPRATRERLWQLDPRMAAIVASLFANELAV